MNKCIFQAFRASDECRTGEPRRVEDDEAVAVSDVTIESSKHGPFVLDAATGCVSPVNMQFHVHLLRGNKEQHQLAWPAQCDAWLWQLDGESRVLLDESGQLLATLSSRDSLLLRGHDETRTSIAALLSDENATLLCVWQEPDE